MPARQVKKSRLEQFFAKLDAGIRGQSLPQDG
jgi:hypothetical protein